MANIRRTWHLVRASLIGAACADFLILAGSVQAFAASPGCNQWGAIGPLSYPAFSAYDINTFSVAPSGTVLGPWTVGDTITISGAPSSGVNDSLTSITIGSGPTRYANSSGVVTAVIDSTQTSAPVNWAVWAVYGGGGATFTFTCTPANADPPANTNSQNLRALQIAATQTVAAISGQVITGSVEDAIDNAFTNGAPPITLGPNGLFLSFTGQPQRDPTTEEALDALAYAAGGVTYKAPRAISLDTGWSAWADLRGTGFDQSSTSTHEEQINVTAGIGRKLSPDILVGLFTGYEDFSFTMSSIAGKMTGDGGTIGTYAATRFSEHWHADAMAGWTDVFYSGSAGAASGSFTGSRWLGSGGFTGTYGWGAFVNEPSTRIYTLWEHDSAFTDTLGTAQGVSNFSTSRVSMGDEINYPWQAAPTWLITPYLGLYSDYRFSTSSALPVDIPFVGIKDGWSGRVTGGATMSTGHAGPSLSLGGELGGLGAGYDLWSVNARANWPF
jgi:Autotransporter beta-domain